MRIGPILFLWMNATPHGVQLDSIQFNLRRMMMLWWFYVFYVSLFICLYFILALDFHSISINPCVAYTPHSGVDHCFIQIPKNWCYSISSMFTPTSSCQSSHHPNSKNSEQSTNSLPTQWEWKTEAHTIAPSANCVWQFEKKMPLFNNTVNRP